MIHLPRRSVTRFFVPLIDVLILLFCIFLLMPFVSQPADSGESVEPVDPANMPTEVGKLQAELRKAREQLAKAQGKAKGGTAENLSVKVVEIDKANGELFTFDPDRKAIKEQKDAQVVIDKHLRLAGSREPFFLILFPRELSGYPEQQQVDKYRRWFKDVPHGFDNPLAGTAPSP